MVHAPVAMVVTVEPDTLHTGGVLEVNETGRSEVADADKVTGSPTGTPAFASGGGLKAIVCDLRPDLCPVGFTWNDCATSSAGA
jgi:hypothetical protein